MKKPPPRNQEKLTWKTKITLKDLFVSIPSLIYYLLYYLLLFKFPVLIFMENKKSHKVITGVLFLASVSIIIFTNFYLSKIPFSEERFAEGYLAYNLPCRAREIYTRLAAAEPDNVDRQRNLIKTAFECLSSTGSEAGFLKHMLPRYTQRVAFYPEEAVSWWAIGYIYLLDKRDDEALNAFRNALQYNPQLKYLNNCMGFVLASKGQWDEARGYFEKEIAQEGAVEFAIENLIYNAIRFKDIPALQAIIRAPYFGRIAYSLKNNIFYLMKDVPQYIWTGFMRHFEGLDIFALIAVTLIGIFWFLYFSGFDIFERDPLISRLFIFSLGGISTIAAGIWYDFFEFNLGLNLTASFMHNLNFCIFVVGLGEELAKIIPFIFVWRLTRRVNNSYDAILFAGLSGLGFATIENYSYFVGRGDVTFVGRFLTAAPLHFTLSGILGYHLYRAAEYGKEKTPAKTLLSLKFLMRGIIVAVSFHGLYDFILIGPPIIPPAAFLMLIWALSYLMKLIRQSLQIEELKHNKSEIPLHLLPSPFYLFVIYFLLLILIYLDASWTYSPKVANAALLPLYLGTVVTSYFIASFIHRESLGLEEFYGIKESGVTSHKLSRPE